MSENNYEVRFRDQRWEAEESPTPNSIRQILCDHYDIPLEEFHDWAMEHSDEKIIMVRKTDGFQITHSLYIMTRFKDYERISVVLNEDGELELIEEEE